MGPASEKLNRSRHQRRSPKVGLGLRLLLIDDNFLLSHLLPIEAGGEDEGGDLSNRSTCLPISSAARNEAAPKVKAKIA